MISNKNHIFLKVSFENIIVSKNENIKVYKQIKSKDVESFYKYLGSIVESMNQKQKD